MKQLLVIFLLFLSSVIQAQNLVQNGDFEYYTSCPTSYSQTSNCVGWRQYTHGTSDYFHSCGQIMVPNNFFGFQEPASGNAYMGVYSFEPFGTTYYSEYVAGSVTPLVPGYTYEVSISASLAGSSGYGNNGLGIWFYLNGPTATSSAVPVAVTPQVSFASYGAITDTTDWVRLSAKFTADSAYDKMVIGTFFPSTGFSMQKIKIKDTLFSYYYLDSVMVRINGGINNHYKDSTLCARDTFYIPFTLYADAVIGPANVYTAYLSDPSGSFQNGITVIGTLNSHSSADSIRCIVPLDVLPGDNYYVRIMSSDSYDSSNRSVHKITIKSQNGKGKVDLPVCNGSTIHLYSMPAETVGVNYRWTGPNGYFSDKSDNNIYNANTSKHNGRYTMTASGNGCITISYVDVKVIAIDLGLDELLCANETRLLKIDIDNATYLWQDGSTAPEYYVSNPGIYWVRANTECGVLTDTVAKEYENCECNPFVPTAFTPNNDGLNDKVAPIVNCNITAYKFIIANRYGEVVYNTTIQGDKWDGVYNGQPAEMSTYYYYLQITGPRGKEFQYKGDIVLVR